MIAQNIQNRPLSDRQEKFCQIKANEDVSHSEAYRRAGYSEVGADRNSCRLMVKDGIKARIATIRANKAEILAVNRELQTERYTDVARRCKDVGDLSNEIKAYNGIDKLHGLSIDKQQTEQTDAQKARTAVERREAANYAKWKLDRSLARPEGLEEVNVVDITEDNSLVSSSIGCSDDDNSGLTGQEQG